MKAIENLKKMCNIVEVLVPSLYVHFYGKTMGLYTTF